MPAWYLSDLTKAQRHFELGSASTIYIFPHAVRYNKNENTVDNKLYSAKYERHKRYLLNTEDDSHADDNQFKTRRNPT
jgi:hypothetical protein